MTNSDRIAAACEEAARTIEEAANMLEAGNVMLLSLANRPLCAQTTPKVRISLEIRHGAVWKARVSGLPADTIIDVEIRDYDTDGIAPEDLKADENNGEYYIYGAPVEQEAEL